MDLLCEGFVRIFHLWNYGMEFSEFGIEGKH
jgi:hypothetical protein